uniref:G protein-coupled receptor n=1 Tax=Steinernema glaseri TaxID=37863 RepID=A0A1I7XYR7_9BILA
MLISDYVDGSRDVYRIDGSYLLLRHINGVLACASAFFLNVLIIVSIKRLNASSLRHFRGLLVAVSVLDIFYAFASGITSMGFEYYNEGFLIVVTGICTWGPSELSRFAYIFYIVTFNAFFILQPVLFICRYITICLPKKVSVLKKPSVIVGGLSSAVAFCVVEVYLCASTYSLTSEHPRFEAAETGEEIFVDAQFLTSAGADSLVLAVQSALLNVLVLTSIGSMAYCSARIFVFLKRNASSFSERTRLGQRRLTVALILQTIVPILTGVVPLYVGFYMFFNQVALKHILWYTVLLHVWQPTISALITIAFVTPVRTAIRRLGCTPSRTFTSEF